MRELLSPRNIATLVVVGTLHLGAGGADRSISSQMPVSKPHEQSIVLSAKAEEWVALGLLGLVVAAPVVGIIGLRVLWKTSANLKKEIDRTKKENELKGLIN